MRFNVLFFAPLVLLLTACGPGSAIVAGTANPTSLHVTRTESLPDTHVDPLDVMIADVPAVQQLYHAAFALPQIAQGKTYNCGNDHGLVYHLEFFQDGASVQQMSLDATGCEFLTINQGDVRMSDDAFRELLRTTLGIPSLVPPGIYPGDD